MMENNIQIENVSNKNDIQNENGEETNLNKNCTNSSQATSKIIILDTSNFIRLKTLNLSEGWKYFTTEFIIKEIKDEKARDFYNLNKDFIGIKNPTRESMKFITNFAKLSNDLKALSVPDLSILSLAYEMVKNSGQEEVLRKVPPKLEVVEKVDCKTKEKSHQFQVKDDEGFVEVKSKLKTSKKKYEIIEEKEKDDEEGWITPENMYKKLSSRNYDLELENQEKDQHELNIHISSSDFTLQNVALKMGIPVMSIDGMKIRKIKNYILKCYSCQDFNFDTSRLFCEFCGYNTLMKIGCSINSEGRMKIYDKQAEARIRGTQFDLPKPSLSKKGVIYILAEDQIPKKKIEINLERDLDKILDNYDSYIDFNPYKLENKIQNTSKQFVWGYPKKNPNVAKKYHAKKHKK